MKKNLKIIGLVLVILVSMATTYFIGKYTYQLAIQTPPKRVANKFVANILTGLPYSAYAQTTVDFQDKNNDKQFATDASVFESEKAKLNISKIVLDKTKSSAYAVGTLDGPGEKGENISLQVLISLQKDKKLGWRVSAATIK